ncbi:AEC family transporter [Streptomyces sp. NPDC014872]|uniref:AEC family transporter n=1 Tax=Streptomyces sp. NPDC014872 TaxID=3364926 RepID=UPI0036F6EC47
MPTRFDGPSCPLDRPSGGNGGGEFSSEGDSGGDGGQPLRGPAAPPRTPVRDAPRCHEDHGGHARPALRLHPHLGAHRRRVRGRARRPAPRTGRTGLVRYTWLARRREPARHDGFARHDGPARCTEGTARAEVAVVIVLKTLVQPLIAYGVGGPLLRLSDPQLLAVVVCSALPTAQNVFVYAQQYGLDTRQARDFVVASTVVSMATLSLVVWALGTAA